MNFENWLKSTKLSKSSIDKYHGAIKGALSDWAIESEIICESILDITTSPKFNSVSAEIQKLPIFIERDATGHHMYSNALKKYFEFLTTISQPIEKDIELIIKDSKLKSTEKIQLINSRIGQGLFKKKLIDYWGCCSVTGYSNSAMLVASHIKPWSHSSNLERLDRFNGLLLVPNLDKAFDQGFISFQNSGEILISQSFQNHYKTGIVKGMSINLAKEHQLYMEYHRLNVFIDPY